MFDYYLIINLYMFRKVIFKNIIWENASLNLRISYVRGSILIIIIIYHSSNKVYKSDNNKSDNNRRYNTTKEEHPNRKNYIHRCIRIREFRDLLQSHSIDLTRETSSYEELTITAALSSSQ